MPPRTVANKSASRYNEGRLSCEKNFRSAVTDFEQPRNVCKKVEKRTRLDLICSYSNIRVTNVCHIANPILSVNHLRPPVSCLSISLLGNAYLLPLPMPIVFHVGIINLRITKNRDLYDLIQKRNNKKMHASLAQCASSIQKRRTIHLDRCRESP